MQGRDFEITFTQYYMEHFNSLEALLQAADNYRPTDVLLNYGIWFNTYQQNTTCGEDLYPGNFCPHMPKVCEFFKSDQFNVYWQTTTPSKAADGSGVVFPVSEGHNLNPVTRCGLRASQVIDRNATLTALQPNATRRAELYFDKNHLHTQPYHAFNLNMVTHLSRHRRVSLWK
jgi:hypothetical protein